MSEQADRVAMAPTPKQVARHARAAELIAGRRNEMRAYRESMAAIRALAARIEEAKG